MTGHLMHLGPIGTLTLIGTISTSTIRCLLQQKDQITLIVFVIEVAIILFSYLRAVHAGGGFVEKGWKPDDKANRSRLQYCTKCDGYKAPRTHHCSTCNRCVKRMDHHCPWINGCVGHDNLGAFICFTSSVPIGAGHAAYIQICYILSDLFRSPRFIFSFPCLVLLSIGLSISMIIGAGLIGTLQWKGLMKNETQIESWIMTKTTHRERSKPFEFPYDLGWKQNIKSFFSNNMLSLSDGITYETREGSTLYSLSEEQLIQKQEKYHYSALNRVTEAQSTWHPCCRFGCRTCLCRSIMDPLIAVKEDEIIRTFHHRNNWAWGEHCHVEIREGLSESEVDAIRLENPGMFIQYFNDREVVRPKVPRSRGRFPLPCIQKKDQGKKKE